MMRFWGSREVGPMGPRRAFPAEQVSLVDAVEESTNRFAHPWPNCRRATRTKRARAAGFTCRLPSSRKHHALDAGSILGSARRVDARQVRAGAQ